MKKNLTVVCAAVLAVSLASAEVLPYKGSIEMPQIEQDWFTEAAVSMEEALAAAGAEFEGAFTSAKLEVKHGYLVHSLSGIDDAGAIHEFVVDAGNGDILAGLPEETEEEAEEEAAEAEEEEAEPEAEAELEEAVAEEEKPRPEQLELATSMADAIAASLDEFNGFALSCRLAKQGDDWVYTTVIADKDFETATVLIDAATGEVYEPEEEE
ncbi:MAG: PepSY domain-containing protein [candidate division WOR-3 bacterium]|nr:MAG: PepSY domain-containing protein [candidate division WOR-3 bacterium]